MSTIHTHVETLDRASHKANVWLKELAAELGYEDRHHAFVALRASLHALRDRLTVEEAAELGAQLPTLLRGVYYEGWRPQGKPLKERHKAEFLDHIAAALDGDFQYETERVARGVFRFLAGKISSGEMDDVRSILPREIRELLL